MTATAEAPAKAPSTRPRIPGLEGYRGLAAVLVIVFHVYQSVTHNDVTKLPTALQYLVPWFDTMVELFFALSAFLLAMPYLQRAVEGRTAGSSAEFLRRRAIRIVPLYLIVITVVWAFRNGALPGDWRDLLEHLTFTQGFDNGRIFYTDGPAWSLAVEVHFYLLLAVVGPLLCAGAARIATRRGRIALCATVLGLLALASLTYKLLASYVWHRPPNDWRIWFSLPAKLDVFAVGMLAALVVVVRQTRAVREPAAEVAREEELTGSVPAVSPATTVRPSAVPGRARPVVALPSAVAWVLGVLSAGALAVSLLQYKLNGNEHVVRHTWAGLGFALLVMLTVTQQPRALVRFLEWGPMAFLGLVSYGVYLWQEPLLILLTNWGLVPTSGGALATLLGSLIVVPASVLVAWATYWLIEWPTGLLRRTRDSHGRPRTYYA